MKTFNSGQNSMSVLFFMVLVALGLDSTFAWAETFLAYTEDGLQNAGIRLSRWKIVGLTCAGFFLCGLPYCTQMGNELLDTMDHYVVAYCLLFGVAMESFMFLCNFGWRRLSVAVRRATFGNSATPRGRKLSPFFWRFCLVCTVPGMCLLLFLHIITTDLGTPYEGYPAWMQAIGWSSLVLTLSMTPLGLFRRGKSSLVPLTEDEQALAKE